MKLCERENIFPNPNYCPEKWNEKLPKLENGLTGVSIIDAANILSQKIEVDSLTGCFNRQYYENLKLHFDAKRTKNAKVAIIFIDLNGLKEINDNFGHAQGDEIICLLAFFLKMKFRKSDEIIRLGGDEFLIYCHNHDNDFQFENNLQKKVQVVQENFKKQLQAIQIPSNGFAAGVAVFDKDIDCELDHVLQRADHLMYENKRTMKGTIKKSVII